MDEIIINQLIDALDFTREEVISMYHQLNLDILRIPINTCTIMFDSIGQIYGKEEIKDILKKGKYIRVIFNLKKISCNPKGEITLQIETLQIEQA